jgi:riboflavin biosynthesis pyrimidine reductase
MAHEAPDPRQDSELIVEISLLSDEQLSDIYAWPQVRSFRLNMLLDAAGSSAGIDGTSNSLTTHEDRRLLRIIRNRAHVVIVGAQSLRSEGWFLPPHGRLAVLSRSGNIPWDTCPDKSRVSVFPSPTALIHSLRKGETHILCEGGISTAKILNDTIGFDEIALSRIGDGDLSHLPEFVSNSPDLSLTSTLVDTENVMTFLYWRRAVEHG